MRKCAGRRKVARSGRISWRNLNEFAEAPPGARAENSEFQISDWKFRIAGAAPARNRKKREAHERTNPRSFRASGAPERPERPAGHRLQPISGGSARGPRPAIRLALPRNAGTERAPCRHCRRDRRAPADFLYAGSARGSGGSGRNLHRLQRQANALRDAAAASKPLDADGALPRPGGPASAEPQAPVAAACESQNSGPGTAAEGTDGAGLGA